MPDLLIKLAEKGSLSKFQACLAAPVLQPASEGQRLGTDGRPAAAARER